jgi:nascent polypeptide-associated complex subunit alpha
MEIFQVIGEYEVIKKVQISDEDVKLIMEQANVSEEEARKALIEANGDLVEALMKLQEKE